MFEGDQTDRDFTSFVPLLHVNNGPETHSGTCLFIRLTLLSKELTHESKYDTNSYGGCYLIIYRFRVDKQVANNIVSVLITYFLP